MKSTVNTSTTLTRHSDTGNVVTSISFVEGMPPMVRVEQKGPSGHRQVIELTLSEIRFFTYALNEVKNFREMAKGIDDNNGEDDGERPFGVLSGGLR